MSLDQTQFPGLQPPSQTETVAEPTPKLTVPDGIPKVVEGEFPDFGVNKPSVYTDLKGWEIYTKDAIAEKMRRDNNSKFYFSADNLGKTTSELQQEEDTLRQDTGFMERLDWLFSNGVFLDEMPDNYFTRTQQDLDATLAAMPVRPEVPHLEKPSQLAMAIGGALSLLAPPGQQFRALMVPASYMMQKNATEIQRADQAYNDRLREWGTRYGLKREQAKMIADREQAEYQARAANLNKVMELRYGAIEKSEDFAVARQKMAADLQGILLKANAEERQTIIKEGFNLMANGNSPMMRLLGQTVMQSATGLDLPMKAEMTPDEMYKLAQTAGLNLDNEFKDSSFQFRLQQEAAKGSILTTEAQYKPRELEAGIGKILAATNLDSVQAMVAEGRLELDGQKLAFEMAGGTAGGIAGTLKGAFDDLDKSYNAVNARLTEVTSKVEARKAEVLKNVPRPNDWWGLNKAGAEAQRKQWEAEALAKDAVYVQLKNEADKLQSDLGQLGERKRYAQIMSPSAIRPQMVDSAATELRKTRSSEQFLGTVARLLNDEKVTPLEMVKAIQSVPMGGVDGKQLSRQIINSMAVDALQDPGLAQKYTDQVMRELGIEGGAGLGPGPFPTGGLE